VQGCHDHTTDGVIGPDDAPEIFVHWSAMVASGLRIRHEDGQVAFQVAQGLYESRAQVVNQVTTTA
jgi:cold shock CspA family protein